MTFYTASYMFVIISPSNISHLSYFYNKFLCNLHVQILLLVFSNMSLINSITKPFNMILISLMTLDISPSPLIMSYMFFENFFIFLNDLFMISCIIVFSIRINPFFDFVASKSIVT